jgi:hypothetical protein
MTINKFLLAVPALCLVVPSVALADGDKPAKPKKICHSVMLTGSRMPTRYCHTAQEWADIDAGKRTADVTSQEGQLGTASRRDNSPTGATPF